MGRSTPLRRRLRGDAAVPLHDESEDEGEGEGDGNEGRGEEGRGRGEDPVTRRLRRWLNAALRLLRTSARARAGVHMVGIALALAHLRSTLRETGEAGPIGDA